AMTRNRDNIERIGFLLLAYFPAELDADRAVVDVGVEIEDMYFENRLGEIADSRPRTDIGDAVAHLLVSAEHLCRVDARQRCAQAAQLQVRSRHINGATQLLADHDPSRHAVWVPQQRFR